jgi:hypothetical protein
MVSVEELGQEIASLSAHLDAATHRLLTCIRQFDEAGGWYEQGALSCAHWLAWRVGLDAATAREKVRVARALGKLPAIDDALRVGKLSYAKVRALTRVATPGNEARLMEMAMAATGAQLERICRGYRSACAADQGPAPEERCLRTRLLPGGMVKLELVLSPDEADLILRAVDRAREVRVEGEEGSRVGSLPALPAADHRGRVWEPSQGSHDDDVSAETPKHHEGAEADAGWPSRADGVVTLAESFLAGHPVSGTGGERFQVMVHVDQDPLGPDGAVAATLDDGTRVSAETLRRVACDCGLVAVGGAGEALDIGRRTRSIPPAIRRVLMLRDRGCAFPGCTHDRFLSGHHVEHWLHGGATSVDNLVMLCTAHHHLVHEGGWTVARDARGQLVFTAPSGKAQAAEPPSEWVDDILTWLREWSDEHGLDLGPDANLPLWDGTRPDYDLAVSGLLAAG